ncbi:unnamed protein product [Didymodactylos carnosus]|uniref:Uncharacterized protein n=1 Tax=Didymodactylos carnosus TaxID=1234261 RepID=A0A815SQ24_9BILA|nr:unnamed protein product [Didymodactylos carnosus]CAF1495775.1 unnamed protein product [Didymodactylos carnosus]CAF3553555.1 unnamed protein product [Didymodactylos carnosus]CAF4358226.1 unnamed protein product [Didymodactylos carnosus]
MVKMITDLLGQLTITDNGLELLCKALKDNIFDDNEFMEMICVTAVRVEDNILLDQLADVLAQMAFEKKTFEFIQNKILNDSSAVQFLKKFLWKIGKLIGQINVDNFDQSFAPFILHYVRLSTSLCES